MGAGPLKGATPRRGVWRRSRPLLLAGTSATTASDLAVFLNGVFLVGMCWENKIAGGSTPPSTVES